MFRIQHLLLTTILGLTLAVWCATGQNPDDFSPRRGLLSIGSYSLSDLETIDNVSGNVQFKIPLASISPARAGTPMALNLIYNSQLYDLLQDFFSHTAAQPPYGPILTTKLMPSEWGAWQYSFNYGLTMEDRQSNPTPDCRSSQDNNYWKSYYLHRLYINFPDG